jgi:hypothetical protein
MPGCLFRVSLPLLNADADAGAHDAVAHRPRRAVIRNRPALRRQTAESPAMRQLTPPERHWRATRRLTASLLPPVAG